MKRLVTIGRLAKAAKVYEWTLARALAASEVLVEHTDVRGSWVGARAAQRAIAKMDLEHLRRLSRQERLTLRTSKHWVAGFPELVAQWHPTRNGDLFPDEVGHGSTKHVWWVCPKGPDHVWRARVQSRTRGAGCPFCTNRSVSVTNSLATLKPAWAKQWHPTKNPGRSPATTLAGATRSVWWKCAKGSDHVWRSPPSHRQGCPYCAGQRVSVTNALSTVAPAIAKEWHPTRNRIRPSDVTGSSHRIVWWRCARDAEHEWRAPVAQRTSRLSQRGCPHCSAEARRRRDSLAVRRPLLLRLWDAARNQLPPTEVGSRSRQEVWWRCPKGPDHAWKAAPAYVQGRCPFCCNHRASVTNSLAALRPDIAKEWHPSKNRPLKPEQVVAGSAQAVWWRCSTEPSHVWRARVVARTGEGTGCPSCYSLLRRGRYLRKARRK